MNFNPDESHSQRDDCREGESFSKIIRRLRGVNGQWSYVVRRYKDNDDVKKRFLVYITIPIHKNVEAIEDKISGLGDMTVSRGKLYIDQTKVNDIKLLCGVISIKNLDMVASISYKFLNRIMKVLFDDENVE